MDPLSVLSTTKLALKKHLGAWLRAIGLARLLETAPRAELEQAALRVAIGGVVLVYLLIYTLRDRIIGPSELEVDLVALAFFLFGVSLVLRIIITGKNSVIRRVIGMIADNAVNSYCLMRMGEGGAVVLGVYLFVTFGNGFRYGRSYLHASQVLGLIGFSLVLYVSPFWSQHLAIGTGLLIAMIVLPFYVGVLAERINESRKRADEANKAKGRFLANVSHEMRTPLNGVIAMADVLAETPLSESQREIVDTLGTSAQLLLAQIEDVLDMAKIEAGRVQIEMRPLHLGQLVTSTIKVVLPQARRKGLQVITDVAPQADRRFEGDAHHLRQVLLNLLANAVKFTESGNVSLTVRELGQDESMSRIRFEVRDTGIGIPPDKHLAIFEPFTQADDSITRIYGGTGLGTTIAKQLVTLMGGTIGLQSELGVGSLFWVEIPFRKTDLESSIAEEASPIGAPGTNAIPEATNRPKRRSAKVLVAEDNETNQRVAQLILDSGGYQTTIVNGGDEALDELERGGYDLAIFDLSMPGVSGLEALKLYRFMVQNPIPVLVLSANVTAEVIAECKSAGAAEFVAKPIRPATLLEAIERNLQPEPQESRFSGAAPVQTIERPMLTVVESAAVDAGVLADLDRLSSDPTFVGRLLAGFRCDAERLVSEISEGLVAHNFEAVKDAAHALKGGAGSVGATHLTTLATRLEKANYETLRVRAVEWTEDLKRAANEALAILERHVVVHHQQRAGGAV